MLMILAIDGIKRDIALSAEVLPAAVAPANSILLLFSTAIHKYARISGE